MLRATIPLQPLLTAAGSIRIDPRARRMMLGLLAGMAMTVVSAELAFVFEHYLKVHNPSMMFLCAVALAAIWFGRTIGVATALFAFGVYNIYLTDPPGQFAFAGLEDVLTLSFFVGAALLISNLAGRMHDERERARERARVFASLFAISRRVLERGGRQDICDLLIEGMESIGARSALLIQSEGGTPTVAARGAGLEGASPQVLAAAAELLAKGAEWEPREEGGWRLHRLDRPGHAATVLAWLPAPSKAEEGHALAERLLLELGAVSTERMRLAKQQHELEAIAATERLRTALMSSMSHDFRTPLATILASASSLLEFEDRLGPDARRDMLTSIQEEAERLSQFTRNILSMTRLEGDFLRPRLEWSDPLEILESVAERLKKRVGDRQLTLQLPAAAPSIFVDPILAQQAIANVLENAFAYTPPGAAIRAGASYTTGAVQLWIEDDGPGVPPGKLARIFDKFQRVSDAGDRQGGGGLGLGLAISKGFVEAMGGEVEAASPAADGRGLRVRFSFPRVAEAA
ncbi:MAG: DUF4118 domain-containing protein [Hyphomonadaceae bacterium]|nr:DUF4118 domain-containing protein [Hyphomonadaceae bacterium]